MKKIKTMLTVIAAFAVIGGALAFKATKSVHSIWTYHSGLNECIFVAGLKNITASTLAVHGHLLLRQQVTFLKMQLLVILLFIIPMKNNPTKTTCDCKA